MTEKTAAIQQPAGCDSDHDPHSLPMDAAWQRILSDIEPVRGVEWVNVRQALERVLARPISSPVNVPAHDNSAMDGYAIRAADLPASGDKAFRVLGVAYAGHPFDGQVGADDCVQIMTGAAIPDGADTVVIQENVQREGDLVRIRSGETGGQNVRRAGEDLTQGQVVLDAGQRIGPAELGLLGSLGMVEVPVQRRLRVAFFSTGDELRSAGAPLKAGQIYDSNRYTLYAMLQRLGVELTDMGVVPDDPTALEQAFAEAARFADAIISSGGVSVGEADYVKQILERLGEVNFWKIAVRPGRPLAFGTIGRAYFFGMPGNPVSVVATWYQFVQPALRHLMGQRLQPPHSFRVRTVSNLRKRPGRTEVQRGILERDESGELVVRSTGHQGSGILRSVSMANCFIVLPHDGGSVAAGEVVEVQPFEGIMGL